MPKASTILPLLMICIDCFAGEADVLDVQVDCDADRVCDFAVTVRHDDNGWDHYANRWEILAPDGDVIGVRELLHPHDNEQPFTRSLTGIQIPDGLRSVIVRALDSRHGAGGETLSVEISGE